jgi:hypothetical protein
MSISFTQTIDVFVFLLFLTWGSSQLAEWKLSSLSKQELPGGVKIYESYVSDRPSLGAWLIVADINSFNTTEGWDLGTYLSKDTDSLSTVREFCADFSAVIGTNGGFFGTSNGNGVSYSLAAADSTLSSANIAALTRNSMTYYPTRCAFGLNNSGSFDAYWVYAEGSSTLAYTKPSPNYESSGSPQPKPNSSFPTTSFDWELYLGVGGGPMLVFDSANVALDSFDAEVMWGSGVPSDVAAARTAIGVGVPTSLSLSTPHLLWIAVDGEDDVTGISLPNLADEFLKLGSIKACNLDGGGSTQLVVNNKLINLPDRGTYERQLAASVMLFGHS